MQWDLRKTMCVSPAKMQTAASSRMGPCRLCFSLGESALCNWGCKEQMCKRPSWACLELFWVPMPRSGCVQHVWGSVVLDEAGWAAQDSLVWWLVLQFRLQRCRAGLPELDYVYSFAVAHLLFYIRVLYLLFKIIVCWCVILQIQVWNYNRAFVSYENQ